MLFFLAKIIGKICFSVFWVLLIAPGIRARAENRRRFQWAIAAGVGYDVWLAHAILVSGNPIRLEALPLALTVSVLYLRAIDVLVRSEQPDLGRRLRTALLVVTVVAFVP